jgi:hypothetical protein
MTTSHCHCEERSDEAISLEKHNEIATASLTGSLARTILAVIASLLEKLYYLSSAFFSGSYAFVQQRREGKENLLISLHR